MGGSISYLVLGPIFFWTSVKWQANRTAIGNRYDHRKECHVLCQSSLKFPKLPNSWNLQVNKSNQFPLGVWQTVVYSTLWKKDGRGSNLDVTVKFDKDLCLSFLNKLQHVNHLTSVLRFCKSLFSYWFKFWDDSVEQNKPNTPYISRKFLLTTTIFIIIWTGLHFLSPVLWYLNFKED